MGRAVAIALTLFLAASSVYAWMGPIMVGAGGGGGAISYDTHNSNSGFATDSVTVGLTIGSNSNRLLVVGIGWEDTTATYSISTVTFAGNAMTPINAQQFSTSTNGVALYYALQANVPTGADNVVVTFTGSMSGMVVGAISVYGAKQQAPEAEASDQLYPGTSTNVTVGITTVSAKAWVFEVASNQSSGSTLTANSGQTDRFNLAQGMRTAGGHIERASAGLYTASWTLGPSASQWLIATAAFAPN